MTGFAALHRQALDNPLLDDASRLGAWTWLILRAAWKPTPFRVGGSVVTLKRGQLCVSIRQLAAAWGWSKSSVDRFLTRLETGTMIEREAGQGRCIITICNYCKYQDVGEAERDSSGTVTGTRAGQQRDTKEQGNKETKEPNGSKARKRAADCPDGVSEGTWKDFLAQRKKAFTDTALKGFIREAEKAGWPLEEAFAYATMRGWEGFNADWVEHRSKVTPLAKPQSPAEIAAFYRKIGRDDEAEEIEQRERRRKATGPPRSIGELAKGVANAAR